MITVFGDDIYWRGDRVASIRHGIGPTTLQDFTDAITKIDPRAVESLQNDLEQSERLVNDLREGINRLEERLQ